MAAVIIEVLTRINRLKLEPFTFKSHQREASLSLDFSPNIDHNICPLGLLHGPESLGGCRALSSIYFC